MARPSSMHVDRSGDGRVRVQGCHDTHTLDFDAPGFDNDVVTKSLGKDLARAAAIGCDFLERITPPTENQSAIKHFSIDEDGTTVGKEDKPLVALPLGLDELDQVESILFQLVPAT